MKKLLLLLLFICGVAHSQEILSGYVYDEAENKPLEGAFVYLDGTTFSANSDARGFFKIVVPQKYNAQLVVSYIGFETIRVDDPFKYGKPFKAVMRMDATTLDEVVITNKSPFTRRQMLSVFRKEFLGRSKAGRSCKIENEDDVYLFYDESTHTLKARCSKPIRIVNKRLGYNIGFDLIAFQVQYNTTTLDENYMYRSFFAGTTAFTDTDKKGEALKNRKASYEGSVTHLMKTIKGGDWKGQKFSLYVDRVPSDPKDYFEVSDSLTYTKVKLNEAAMAPLQPKITLRGKDAPAFKYRNIDFIILRNMNTGTQSAINFDQDHFYIDQNGLFFPLDAITFKGYMGMLKAGDLLPADYKPAP